MQLMDNEKRYSFTDFLNKPSTRKKVVTNEMRQLALTIKGTEDESKIEHLVGMQYHREPVKAKVVEEKGPSFLETAVSQAIEALVQMDIRFQVKLVMEDLLTSVVQKSSESQEASYKEEIAKYQSELQKLEVTHYEKKEKRKEKEEECELKVNDLKRIEKLNMNEKVRLLCRSKDLETELGRALEQRDRFQRMKDISQLEPKLVFKVLEFLEVVDIAHIVATCRAWRFSLHKPMYWRHVRSRAWKKKYFVETTEHRVPTYPAPDLKTKTHVVRIQRKMNEPNSKNSKRLFKKRALASYNKDEIYQECITQSGKRTTAIESDREEIAEKAKVGAGLVLFMRSKMRDAMHQLGQIRVETYRQEQKVQEVRTSKQRLDLDIRAVEHEVEKQKGIIARHKEKQQKMREAQRVYEDLQMLEEPRGNEETQRMKAVKSSLVRQVVKLRKDLQRVKKEKKKFITRVDTLSQSHDFLP